MLKIVGTIILVVIILGFTSYGYSNYNKKSDPEKISQIIPENPKATITPDSYIASVTQYSPEDPFTRITLNNPNLPNIRTHLEKDKNYYNIIGEYRPKSQNHDFPLLSVTKWALKDRPDATVPFEEIVIDGKHAKHYKDQQTIFIEDLPLNIRYTRNTGQLGHLSDTEFQSLLNSIQIN